MDLAPRPVIRNGLRFYNAIAEAVRRLDLFEAWSSLREVANLDRSSVMDILDQYRKTLSLDDMN